MRICHRRYSFWIYMYIYINICVLDIEWEVKTHSAAHWYSGGLKKIVFLQFLRWNVHQNVRNSMHLMQCIEFWRLTVSNEIYCIQCPQKMVFPFSQVKYPSRYHFHIAQCKLQINENHKIYNIFWNEKRVL